MPSISAWASRVTPMRAHGVVELVAEGRALRFEQQGVLGELRPARPVASAASGWSGGARMMRSSSNRGSVASSPPPSGRLTRRGRGSRRRAGGPATWWWRRRRRRGRAGGASAIALEQAGDEPAADRADAPEPDGAGHLVEHRVDVGPQRLELVLDATGPGHHDVALVGQRAGRAVDQGGSQLRLEPGDVGGHVRLHGVQPAGGGRERSGLGDGGQGGELAEVHRSQ